MATRVLVDSAFEQVLRWIDGDPVLRLFREGEVRIGMRSIVPSGVDLAAAAVARCGLFPAGPRQVALALPRGRSGLPLFLGLYFVVGRLAQTLPLNGSIAVSTRESEYRELVGRIYVQRLGAPVPAGRLVTGKPDPSGHAPARIGELLGTRRLHGLAPDKLYLLLQPPHYRPELGLNALSVSVVDANDISPDAWASTWAWNRDAKRAQVWIGELGDRRFEDFCIERGLPLWRLHWGQVADLTARFGVGASTLATTRLCRRAADQAPLGVRLCLDGAIDEELARLEVAFAAVYRRTKGEEVPAIILRARRLHYLLARLVAPLSVYEPIAAGSRALEPRPTLAQVRTAPLGWFQGANWKSVYESEWGTIRAALTVLHDLLEQAYPKYYDALELVEQARATGRRLVFRSATKTEANALATAFVAHGFLEPEELGEGNLVDVRWFGAASPALAHGPADKLITTVISEPPPPFAASAYLSGEEGALEASLYPVQLPRFERLARAATAATADGNAAALGAFVAGLPGDGCQRPSEPTFFLQAPFAASARGVLKEAVETKEMLSMQHFFDEVAALRPDDEISHGGSGNRPAASEEAPARLIASREGIFVFLPEDEQVPVLLGEAQMVPRHVSELRHGQRIVLIPGGARGELLADLYASFDRRLGPAYPLLYEQAFEAAYLNAGGTDEALAARVGVHPSTVASWRRRDHRPQQTRHLYAILELSRSAPAWQNRQAIRLYLATVRGRHRLIARIFDEAVIETVVEVGGARQERLARLGLELDEFLGSIQVLKVDAVSAASQPVPASLIGHFLTSDHPLVKGAA